MSELKPCLSLEAAIEHAKERAANLGDCVCAAEHAQLAVWLEELVARRAQPDNEPLVRCGECEKYQTQWCAAKHEQALTDFCSHGIRKPEPEGGES